MEREPRHSINTNSRWHDFAYWGLIVLACLAFLVMNVLTTFKEDELGFFLIDGVWTPVKSFADALRSLHNHYLGTNGRLADVLRFPGERRFQRLQHVGVRAVKPSSQPLVHRAQVLAGNCGLLDGCGNLLSCAW